MEDLTLKSAAAMMMTTLPDIIQYGVRLSFRVTVIGQIDSGKTHSIMKRWLRGKMSFGKPSDEGVANESKLQHCLYCSNGGMSVEEKTMLLGEFVHDKSQKLFHINQFPEK